MPKGCVKTATSIVIISTKESRRNKTKRIDDVLTILTKLSKNIIVLIIYNHFEGPTLNCINF